MSEARTEHDIVVNGITLHVTEQGTGPLVLLFHGWPELAYSWRHQIPVLAHAGYCCRRRRGDLQRRRRENLVGPRADYADAAAMVLCADGNAGKTYELAGDSAYTPR